VNTHDVALLLLALFLGIGGIVMGVVLLVYHWWPEHQKRKWWRM
jgi:hypothetical protein